MTGNEEPTVDRKRRRGRWRVVNLLLATVVAGGLVFVSLFGSGPIPALGALLNPGTGVWTDASGASLPVDQTITVPGLDTTATVGFEDNGVAHIDAGSDADMFRAIGFVHATFRIFQMDLIRRQAAGKLSEVIGAQGVESDKFELDLGLLRAAERDWEEMPEDSPAKAALVDYSAGINSAIDQMIEDDTLPMYFKVLDYEPQPWTPVDSLLVQRLMTQTLSLDMRPLTFTYIEQAVGKATFDEWFPATPWNQQYPFDPGPYEQLPLQELPASDPAAPTPEAAASTSEQIGTDTAVPETSNRTSIEQTALATAMADRTAGLPSNAVHTFGNSNVWVVSGSKTASGEPILASDPHLSMTMPSVWFQLSATSPSYSMTGVTLPGVPVVLIGKNKHISWGIANSQHQSTFFYLEKTDPSRPDQYYWNGAWQPMAKVNYTINVKGQSPVEHVVRITTHGPIMTDQDVTASMWWVGTLPSENLDSALELVKADNFTQFREALRGWGTPAENFAYADDAGNIGIVNAGYSPQSESSSPYLPMSGTGDSEVTGSVPFDALPVTYNPPEGFAAASNQREVTADYPYFWGRGYDFFDQGWRQAEIVSHLQDATDLTVADTTALQLSLVDGVARAFAPTVIAAMEGQQLSPTEQTALAQLKSWDYNLSVDSAAATIWLRFVRLYEYEVFHPNWEYYDIPAPPRDEISPSKTGGGYAMESMRGMLVTLSQNDPGNELFSPPGTPDRTAIDAVRTAFSETIEDLAGKNGPDPETWAYGNAHFVMFESLLRSTPLDVGPFTYGSGGRTLNSILGPPPVRDGKTLTGVSTGGASWRFVIDWGTGEAISSLPGGASENPVSPWYANGVSDWLAGRYGPVLEGTQAAEATEGRTWTLQS